MLTTKAKIPVGIVGATGIVGQRLVSRLSAHPWFELVWLGASVRTAGRLYGEAVKWRMTEPLCPRAAALPISAAEPGGNARMIFSALESAAAAELEPAFAAAGHAVVTNSSPLRMDPAVPLLIPEINPAHLALIERQPTRAHGGGFVVANPNCCVAGLALALAPLQRTFGLDRAMVVTLQAISGAGYPGLSALDILNNVIPYIAGEEEKIETETRKILGEIGAQDVVPAPLRLSAQCFRVPVEEGHTLAVSVKLAQLASEEAVRKAWREFRGEPRVQALPTAPPEPLLVDERTGHPQPRSALAAGGGGMSVTVGGLRRCGLLDYKFTLLVHNTMRGAAGAALLNAELLRSEGLV